LYLEDAKVADAGLEHLKCLTRLQMLDLIDTKVTDTGVDKLRKELPKTEIVH
jgi:hypothetical protein